MPHRPTTMGLETEFGMLVQNGDEEISEYFSQYAAYETVKAIKRINLFVDRGLEEIEDIEEHDRAEEEAQRNRLLHLRYEKRRELSAYALRQRLGMSGFILETGARWYVDMGHPEYSTPETHNPRTLVLVQKAGDVIAEQCRRFAEVTLRSSLSRPDLTLHIHRNNSDGKGHSYAGHENYSLSIELFDQIVRHLEHNRPSRRARRTLDDMFTYTPTLLTHAVLKFFVTRQIVTGSGKVGSELYNAPIDYQISQRADFMMQPIGISTIHGRGIINTRNQPLADYDLMRRFHVICGDSNMSELSIYLKCGITALFFMMLEEGYIQASACDLMEPLADSVHSYRRVSRDLTLQKELLLADGSSTTALQTQMQYCMLAKSFVEQADFAPVWTDVVHKWEAVLNGLDNDRTKDPWASNLDWVVKEWLLNGFQKRHKVDPLDIRCQALALDYHDINPERSNYNRLINAGKIMRIATDTEIMYMTHERPPDSRAWLRGLLIKKYSSLIVDIGWDYALFENHALLDMSDPHMGTKEHIDPHIADDPSLTTFLERIQPRFRMRKLKPRHG